jgi:hypothetical protein
VQSLHRILQTLIFLLSNPKFAHQHSSLQQDFMMRFRQPFFNGYDSLFSFYENEWAVPAYQQYAAPTIINKINKTTNRAKPLL